MVKFNTSWFKHKDEKTSDKGMIGLHSLYAQITPLRGYHFFSDYFKIDDCYASILTFFHQHGSDRHLVPMWGVNLLPRNLGRDVSTHLLIGIRAMTPHWISKHQNNMDSISSSANTSANESNHTKTKIINHYRQQDVDIVNADLTDGDSYFKVDFKLLIKAQSLAKLDHAVDMLSRTYDQWFGKLYLHAYDGQQYEDLQRILQPADDQIGRNYMLTASELSGVYNLVSHGINDDYGEYMGVMTGDINQAAVVWDIDDFNGHVIVAADQRAQTRVRTKFPKGTRGSTMWSVKLSQDCLINNHRVVHLILNNAQIDKIGMDLSAITTHVAMNHGAINPFEMFGPRSESLSIFPAHIEKLRLMAKQIVPSLTSVDLGKYFSQIVQDFYIDHKMWYNDAPAMFSLLRVVGIPHTEVPRLQDFCVYLDAAEKFATQENNQRKVNSIEKLQSAFDIMLDENRGLFNQFTSNAIDSVNSKPQVIYDFSDLMQRGRRIAMAQFLNAFSFAVGSLQAGDLLIIDGAEEITGNLKDEYSVKAYVADMIGELHKKGVRVAYMYDSISDMLDPAETKFNNFDSADWVLTGYMSNNLVLQYQKDMNRNLPPDLSVGMEKQSPLRYYLRRGASNVLFEAAPSVDYTDASAY